MEQLFTAVRDMAVSTRMTEADAERMRDLIDSLRAPTGAAAAPSWDACKEQMLRHELTGAERQGKCTGDRGKSKGSGESEVLHEQLQSAQQLLQRRLKSAWRC